MFVTAGAANPTSTIVALALRAADHLVERRRDMPTPSHTRATAGFGRGAATLPVAAAAIALPPPGLTNTMPATDRTPGRSADPGGRRDARRIGGRRGRSAARPGAGGPPDLTADLRRVLEAVGDHPDDATLAALDTDDLRTLRYLAAAAYYLVPLVHDRLGYRPVPATPVRALDYPEYLDEGLLDHLVDH